MPACGTTSSTRFSGFPATAVYVEEISTPAYFLYRLPAPDGSGCIATEGPFTARLPSARITSLSTQGVLSAIGFVVFVTSVCEWYTIYISLPSGDLVILQCPVPEVYFPSPTRIGLSLDFV